MRFTDSSASDPIWGKVFSVEFTGRHPANALDIATLRGLTRVIKRHRDHVLVISSQGKTFSAGLDLMQVVKYGSAAKHLRSLIALYDALADHPRPTVCLIEQAALGGGVGLALCADVVVATCNASFSLPGDRPYRPLAEVLFPVVAARRSVDRDNFDRWYGNRVGAQELFDNGYVDAVLHAEGTTVATGKLRETAGRILADRKLLERTNLNRRRRRPNRRELTRRIKAAVAASRRVAFSAGVRADFGHERDPKAVFVVHGRNHHALKAVRTFLKAFGLKQLLVRSVLLGRPNAPLWDGIYGGLKLAQAVLVLFTPDEETRLTARLSRTTDETRLQSRPNVFVEAGLALGMCEERTVLLRLGPAEMPADLVGHYRVEVPSRDDWRRELADLLECAGCQIRRPLKLPPRAILERWAS